MNPSTKLLSPWFMWLCAASFYLYQFVLRVCPGVIGDNLVKDLDINCCTFGMIGACFYHAYATMQIPLGIALDRYGVRKTFSICCLISAAGAIIFALSTNAFTAGIGRLLTGAGAACGFIGVVKLITIIFDNHKIARVVGITTLLGTIGGTIGGAPLGYLTTIFDWRTVVFVLGCIGIIIAFTVYNVTKINTPTIVEEHNSMQKLLAIAKNRQIWLLGAFGGLMYVPLAVIADLWGTPFMMLTYNISKQHASFVSSCIYIGVSFGAPIVTYASDLINKRKILMYICAFVSLITYYIIVNYKIHSIYTMCALLFIGGFSFGGQCLVFSLVVRMVKANSSGIALGFMNTMIMLSGAFEAVIGYLLDYKRSGTNFTVDNYQYALNVVPICLGISILVLHYIKDSQHDNAIKIKQAL